MFTRSLVFVSSPCLEKELRFAVIALLKCEEKKTNIEPDCKMVYFMCKTF